MQAVVFHHDTKSFKTQTQMLKALDEQEALENQQKEDATAGTGEDGVRWCLVLASH